MNMKKLLITAIAMMASLNINAQIEEGNWYFTPKLGVGLVDLSGKLYDPSKEEGTYDPTLRSYVSFTGGVEFEYAMLDQLGLSVGLNYARQGSKTSEDVFKVTMDYANIPVTFNFYPIPNVGLAIKAGVQVGFAARKKMKINGVEYNADFDRKILVNRWGRAVPVLVENEYSRQFNKTDFSIPLAISFDYKRIFVEARYNLGLTNVMKDDPEKSKHRVWQFTLGYKIPLGD